jgi:hypothetical protein
VAYLANLPALVEEIDGGTIVVSARSVPLADLEAAWIDPDIPAFASHNCRPGIPSAAVRRLVVVPTDLADRVHQ